MSKAWTHRVRAVSPKRSEAKASRGLRGCHTCGTGRMPRSRFATRTLLRPFLCAACPCAAFCTRRCESTSVLRSKTRTRRVRNARLPHRPQRRLCLLCKLRRECVHGRAARSAVGDCPRRRSLLVVKTTICGECRCGAAS